MCKFQTADAKNHGASAAYDCILPIECCNRDDGALLEGGADSAHVRSSAAQMETRINSVIAAASVSVNAQMRCAFRIDHKKQ